MALFSIEDERSARGRERVVGESEWQALSLCSLCALPNAAGQSHCSVAMASAPNMLDELELQHDSGSAATAILELDHEVDLNPELPVPTKPQLRFYSVGPSTYRVLCPLCQQSARTETVQMAGAFGQLSCLLSVFSWCVCSSSTS